MPKTPQCLLEASQLGNLLPARWSKMRVKREDAYLTLQAHLLSSKGRHLQLCSLQRDRLPFGIVVVLLCCPLRLCVGCSCGIVLPSAKAIRQLTVPPSHH